MRPHAFALLCWFSMLFAVQPARGRGRGYHRGSDHPGRGRGYGAYGAGYGDRHSAVRNGGGHGGYRVPPPPTDECTPPCYWTYGVPGQEKCHCPGGSPAGHVDEIVDLPGLSFKPNFKHYSGYLNASETRFLHYWFVESESTPSEDPLVFWFNGGPGCSSMEGLLAEHGPYFLSNDTTTLKTNPYAWNQLANVIYIESPAFVGFSYHTEGDSGIWNDETTSAESYRAIKHFFWKFPQFRDHSVFVTGESYAGIYVPTLAERIIDGQKEFPVKFEGVAIGNGLFNDELDTRGLDDFARGHGLGSRFLSEVPNVYDIYRDCEVPISDLKLHALLASRKVSVQTYSRRKLSDGNLPLCNPHFGPYLRKPKVRHALHIPDHVGSWELCTTGVYNRTDDHNMHPQITKILNNNVRVLLYYGDTDATCNFLGGQYFVDSLALNATSEKQAWRTDDGILRGYKTEYEKNLTYITVRGVGHMVPQWQPKGALYFMRQFLKNQKI